MMIGRQAAGRHDAVHVRMADKGLAPRVEDAQATDLGSQMARVGGDLAQRGRARPEEPAVHTTRIAVAERQERVRQREDDACTDGTSRSSRSRAASHRSRACA